MAIREELELDTSAALAAVQALGEALQATAALFGQQLLDAIEGVLAGVPTFNIPLNLEATSDAGEVVTQDLSEATAAEVSIPTEIEQPDSQPFTDAIDEGAAAASPETTLAVEGELDPTGITTGIAEGIQAASGETVDATVNLNGDATNAEAAIESLPTDVDATLNLDTSQAEAALGGLQDSATASLDTTAATESAKSLGAAAKDTSDEVDGLDVAVGGLAVGAKIGTAALAVVAGTAATLFAAAVESEGAIVSFNATLGDLAPAIKSIDANGLSIDLAQLAQNLGSSDEATLAVAQRFAQLGITSGAATSAIDQANSQLFAVAANLRSVNPSLGELDQIAAKAGTAFIRGGRAATALGISLTSSEIKMRAAEQTGKDLNDTFSQYELFAAGASIASEQFGTSVEKNVSRALDNPTLALENIKEVFGDTLELFGTPLIVPVLELIRQGQPILLKFSELLGKVAEALTPIAVTLVKAFEPIVTIIGDALLDAIDGLTPALQDLGESFEDIIASFAVLAPAAGTLITILGTFLAGAIQVVADILKTFDTNSILLITTLGFLAGNITGIISALENLYLAFLVYPVLSWAAVIGLAATAVYGLIRASDDTAKPLDGLNERFFKNVSSIEKLAEAVSRYNAELSNFLQVEEISGDKQLVSDLNALGISVQEFADALADSGGDWSGFLDGIIARYPELGAAIAASTQIGQMGTSELTDEQTKLIRSLGGVQTKFQDLQTSVRASEETELNAAIATKTVSAENVAYAKAIAATRGETDNYRLILQLATADAKRFADAEQQSKILSGEAAKEANDFVKVMQGLTGEIVTGTLTLDNMAEALARTGFEEEQLKAIIDGVNQQLSEFTDTVVGFVPVFIEAFNDLGEKSVGQILSEYEGSITATQEWSDTLVRLAGENKNALVQVAAELGPERTAQLLAGYDGDETALNAHLQRMLELEENARVEAQVAAKIGYLARNGIAIANQEELRERLRDLAVFGPITREDLTAAVKEVQDNAPTAEAAAAGWSQSVVDAFARSFSGDAFGGPSAVTGAVETTLEAGQTAIDENAPALGENLAGQVGAGVASGAAQVAGAVTGAVTQAGAEASPEAVRTGNVLSTSLVGAFTDDFYARQRSVTLAVRFALQAAQGLGRIEAIKTGTSLSEAVVAGLVSGLLTQADVVRNNLTGLLFITTADVLDNARLAGMGVGASLAQGMAEGLARNIGVVTSAAAQAVRDAETAARDEAESESPSKVWIRLGRDLVAGLARGLDDSSQATRAASGVMSRVNATAAPTNNTSISVTVPVTVNGTADVGVGREIGRLAAAELRSVLRSEVRVS